MAVIPGSVRVGGFIAPSDSADTYATQDEFYNRGGWRTVADLLERNAITNDRRKVGMLVRVLNAGSGVMKYYALLGGISNIHWVEQIFGGVFRGNATPVETPDGIIVTFTLPFGERYQTGSLQVFLNGVMYNPASIHENGGRLTFTIVGDTIPDVDDRLALSYLVD